MRNRRRRPTDGAFNPTEFGATAWFDPGTASDAGSGLAFTLPNRLNGAANATTTIDARKPTIHVAANGVKYLRCSASALQAALYAGINDPHTFWVSFWARISSAAGNPVPWSIDSAGGAAASTRKHVAQRFVGDYVNVHDAASPTTLARRFGPTTLWTLNTWVHCIYEIALARGGAENTRGVVSSDGVAVVSNYENAIGSPGDLPSAMAVPTGFLNLFAQNAATGGNGWVGDIADVIMGNTVQSGAPTGCLSAEQRLRIKAFRSPV